MNTTLALNAAIGPPGSRSRRALFATASLIAFGVVACSTITTTSVSPAQIAALETALTVADQLALQYTSLPACPTAAPVCAQPALKTQIKADAQAAFNAVQNLKTVSAAGLPAAYALAETALTTYQAIIPAAQ